VFAETIFYSQNADSYGIATLVLNAVDELLFRWEILNILQSGDINEGLSVFMDYRTHVLDSGPINRSTVFSWYPVCPSKYLHISVCLMHFLYRMI